MSAIVTVKYPGQDARTRLDNGAFFVGRNGLGIQTGTEVLKMTSGILRLTPVSTRGMGHCSVDVPSESVPALAAALIEADAGVPADQIATNAARSKWGGQLVAVFAALAGLDAPGEDDATRLGDLLADLMHWCDAVGVDFDDALRRARNHHHEELLEGN